MFCPKCGKKNEDSSLFCTWCGAGFGSISTQSLSVDREHSAPATEPQVSQPADVEKTLQTVPAEVAAPVESVAAVSAVAESTNPADGQPFSVPTPGVIPQSSEHPTAQQRPVVKTDDLSGLETLFDAEIPTSIYDEPETERHYYTGKHIAICLIVAGIMAAAAGVFAGLYFSTIL